MYVEEFKPGRLPELLLLRRLPLPEGAAERELFLYRRGETGDGRPGGFFANTRIFTVKYVITSDWHLSDTPRRCRASEPDWYAAMERSIRQILDTNLPILFAGDLFNKSYAQEKSHKLIHWLHELVGNRTFIFIPGQHDLPNHSIDLYRESALSIFAALSPSTRHLLPNGLILGNCVDVQLIHELVWESSTKPYPTLADSNVSEVWNKYRDRRRDGHSLVIVAGDNHKGFSTGLGSSSDIVCVPGSLLRLNSDQVHYIPRYYILDTNTGEFVVRYIDTSLDVIEDKVEIDCVSKKFTEFLDSVKASIDMSFDFKQNLRGIMEQNIDKLPEQSIKLLKEFLINGKI